MDGMKVVMLANHSLMAPLKAGYWGPDLYKDVGKGMMMVFLKSILRPKLSVIIPSSKICKRRFMTSGWAFSTSSKRITE